MNATRPIAVGLAVLAVALAGCTGGFTVNQTEPIRVQIEGAPQTVVVREGESKEVNVDTCPEDDDPCDTETVDVRLQVRKVDTGDACQVKVIIKTTSGEVLDEIIIDVGDTTGTGSASATGDGNATGNGTTTATATETGSASSGDTVVQNLVVNVKGNKNIIVVTQALQGSAEVNVQTAKASGHSSVDQDGSDDMTTTAAPTNSTTGTTTGYP